MDELYVKQLEDENEKLRQQLSVLQEVADVAKAKEETVNNIYIPLETEIIDGFTLYDIKQGSTQNSILFTCVRKYRSFFCKEKRKIWNFIARCKPQSIGTAFSLDFFTYPEYDDMDFISSSIKKRANMFFTIARQNKFIYVGSGSKCSQGFLCKTEYALDNKKVRSLKEGKICIENT